MLQTITCDVASRIAPCCSGPSDGKFILLRACLLESTLYVRTCGVLDLIQIFNVAVDDFFDVTLTVSLGLQTLLFNVTKSSERCW